MFQAIEIIGVVLIIALQGYIFFITLKGIMAYRRLLLPGSRFMIFRVEIPITDITTIHPKDILSNIGKYTSNINRNIFKDTDGKPTVEVSLIAVEGKTGVTNGLYKILDTINTYLIRNRSAVADFNLIKDIVERAGNTIEEEINNTISVPLYLGLLGTLVGIIFGLFNISNLSSSASVTQTTESLDAAIPILLGGVKIAMFASFTGLLLTVINSAYYFRKGKTLLEYRKNEFYSFIQVELLPVLNQSINSSLGSLQTNLHKFNEDFTSNIKELAGMMHKNHDAILAQDKVLGALDKIDINEFAKANVKVLRELQNSMDSFKYFNDYVNGLTNNLELTRSVSIRLTKLIDSVDSMNNLALNINRSFAENNRLITFFNDHRTGLDESKAMLKQTVGGVSMALKDAIAELNDTTKESIAELRQMVTREIKLMNEEYPKKWEKLDNLDAIKNNTAQINQNTHSKITEVQNEMAELKKYLLSMDSSLKKVAKQTAHRENWITIIQKRLKERFSRN